MTKKIRFQLTVLYATAGLGVLIFSQRGWSGSNVEFIKNQKQRVIVLTDISNEPDDEQSMVRFLMYSNEYDVEGLIATTSVWLRDKVRPEQIRERVEAFGIVRNNLLKHKSGYFERKHLLSVIKASRPFSAWMEWDRV